MTLPMLSPEQRSQRARIAALTRWSKEDPARNAARGQAGLLAKFEREIRETNPDVSDTELRRRAEAARRAHMARMAFNSAKVRAARKATPESA
jgi:hypothetical protein